jgi:hypothetical protein
MTHGTPGECFRRPSGVSDAAQPWLLLKGGKTMLETIAIVLLVLWLLGLVSSYTMGGFIHLLLIIAIVMILLRVIRGRSPVV